MNSFGRLIKQTMSPVKGHVQINFHSEFKQFYSGGNFINEKDAWLFLHFLAKFVAHTAR